MTALKALALVPAWLLLTGFSFGSPSPVSTPTPSPSPAPSPSPSPSPSPVGPPPYINLDVTAGDASTSITVSGANFPPGQGLSIYWDSVTKVIGSTTADAHGSFGGVKVKPFSGAAPGLHQICASPATPSACAQFELQGPPSPSPAASPTPSESPSPSASPSESPSPTPILIPAANNTTNNGLDVLLHPPFIFIPFLAALALLAAIVFWYFGARRAGRPGMPSASVVHRSTRPGYGLSDVDIRPMPLGPTPEQSSPTATDDPDEAPPITES